MTKGLCNKNAGFMSSFYTYLSSLCSVSANSEMQRSASGHTALNTTRAKYNLCSKHMAISEVRKIVKVISDYNYRYR
jgi:hypothetical protein